MPLLSLWNQLINYRGWLGLAWAGLSWIGLDVVGSEYWLDWFHWLPVCTDRVDWFVSRWIWFVDWFCIICVDLQILFVLLLLDLITCWLIGLNRCIGLDWVGWGLLIDCIFGFEWIGWGWAGFDRLTCLASLAWLDGSKFIGLTGLVGLTWLIWIGLGLQSTGFDAFAGFDWLGWCDCFDCLGCLYWAIAWNWLLVVTDSVDSIGLDMLGLHWFVSDCIGLEICSISWLGWIGLIRMIALPYCDNLDWLIVHIYITTWMGLLAATTTDWADPTGWDWVG